MASSFLKNVNDWEIAIPETREFSGVTWFSIRVRVGLVEWCLEHRYSEFSELHRSLVANHSVSKELLPPKCYLKKLSGEALESRREGLQHYLSSVLRFLSDRMPPLLVTFLELDKYDIWFMFRNLAQSIRSNSWLESPPKKLRISIVEVSGLSERLKLPCPSPTVLDSESDLCSVLEFVSTLPEVKIFGEDKEFFGSSNIDYKKIPFELSAFRSLKALTFSRIHLGNFVKADDVKSQLSFLKVNKCKLKILADVLLCDNIYKNWDRIEFGQIWEALRTVDLSHNQIAEIDSGLELMPNVTELNLSHNQLTHLKNVRKLQQLVVLRLSHNHIPLIECENIYLPFLKHLDLSNNEITQVSGISQFPALETLLLSFNRLDSFEELDRIGSLSAIVSVDLIGNPVSQKTDYRVKTLGKFGSRAGALCLDNEQCTSHELELIALAQALSFVQQGKSLSYNKNLSLNIHNRP